MIPHEEIFNKNGGSTFRKCQIICHENHEDNGGTLRYRSHIQNADYLAIAERTDTNIHEVVGYVGLRFKNNKWAVSQVATDPQYQGCGIGTALYDYVLQHLKGIDKLHVHVAQDNVASLALHDRFGFTEYHDDKPTIAFQRIVGPEAIYTMDEAIPQEYQVRHPIQKIRQDAEMGI